MNKRKRLKLSEVFNTCTINSDTLRRQRRDEESDLCISSSEPSSLDGELIECKPIDARNGDKENISRQESDTVDNREDEFNDDEEFDITSKFANLANIDKAHKSFGSKRKRQHIGEFEETNLPSDSEMCSVDDEDSRPTVVTWADTSGLPLCRLIDSKDSS